MAVSNLSKFPATFDLVEMKKGFYPHAFNKPENSNYIGPFPDLSYFMPDYFTISTRDEFINFIIRIKRNNLIKKKNFSAIVCRTFKFWLKHA
jgi:hypothetical protein